MSDDPFFAPPCDPPSKRARPSRWTDGEAVPPQGGVGRAAPAPLCEPPLEDCVALLRRATAKAGDGKSGRGGAASEAVEAAVEAVEAVAVVRPPTPPPGLPALYKLLRVGDPILAQWSMDGLWYAATLSSITHGGYPNVLYRVDYSGYVGHSEGGLGVARVALRAEWDESTLVAAREGAGRATAPDAPPLKAPPAAVNPMEALEAAAVARQAGRAAGGDAGGEGASGLKGTPGLAAGRALVNPEWAEWGRVRGEAERRHQEEWEGQRAPPSLPPSSAGLLSSIMQAPVSDGAHGGGAGRSVGWKQRFTKAVHHLGSV